MQFKYNLPVNLLFGRGTSSKIGETVSKYGKRCLVVTGRSSAKKSGLLDRALAQLETAGIFAEVYDRAEPNPLTTTAADGASVARASKCDVVLALGGGSILDAAKAIAFLAVNDGDVSDYIFGKKFSDRALPSVLVPTTCGTGSEGNSFAVLTNPDTGDKKSLRCDAIFAKASIIDPDLMKTMPRDVLASVGFDALCHNMEAYLSAAASPMSDLIALEGMKMVAGSLPGLYADPADDDAWERLAWGSTLGGMAIHVSSVTAPHGFEHPASGLRNVTHGKGLAALTPVLYEASISAAPARFAEISRILGGKDEKDCVAKIRELLGKIGLNVGLSELGVSEADVEWMTENALKVSTVTIGNHPLPFKKDEISRLYRKAL